MKYQLLFGSLSYKGRLYKTGDIVDLDERFANHPNLIKKLKLVSEVAEEVIPLSPGGEDITIEQLLTRNVVDILKEIASLEDKEVIEAILNSEKTGKNRKTVVEVLTEKLQQK